MCHPPSGRGMRKSRHDHSRQRRHHANKQHPRQPRHRTQISIKQRRHQQASSRSGEVSIVQPRQRCERRMFQSRPEPRQKARQPDATGRNRKRRRKAQLPHVQKAQPVPGALRPVNLAQKRIRPARARKCRAQFSPHQSVRNSDRRAQQPRPHRKPVARRRNDQRQRDERPHADHLQHVEQHRGTKPDAPFESARFAWNRVSGDG